MSVSGKPIFLALLVLTVTLTTVHGSSDGSKWQEYNQVRNQLLNAELTTRFNSTITLTPAEQRVNQYLLQTRQEIEKEMSTVIGGSHPGAHPFYEIKEFIENSRLFPMLHSMPKGGVLHDHSTSISHPMWVIRNMTYDDHHVYYNPNTTAIEYYRDPTTAPDGFIQVDRYRHFICFGDSKCNEMLDKTLMSHFYMTPEEVNTGLRLETKYLWPIFQQIFIYQNSLLSQNHNFRKYLKHGIQAFIEQGVHHIELRHVFGNVLNEEGTVALTHEEETIWLQQLVKEVQAANPDPISPVTVKFIYCDIKIMTVDQVRDSFETAAYLISKYPEVVVGYDLVGDEAIAPLYYFAPALLERENFEEKYNTSIDFYFHAGESTDFYNKNLIDAAFFNSKRIGHGLMMTKYPAMEELFRKRETCIEINPISNQMLGYVADLRNHPATHYLNRGDAVALSSDDPALFLYEGSTHDWYMAFISWGLDLSGLKQLGLNNILYGALDNAQKNAKLARFNRDWKKWIEKMITQSRPKKRSGERLAEKFDGDIKGLPEIEKFLGI